MVSMNFKLILTGTLSALVVLGLIVVMSSTDNAVIEDVTIQLKSYDYENIIFPLMDYCNGIGSYGMSIVDEKIKWSFIV